MAKEKQKLTIDGPAAYRIEVQGYLDQRWSDWFDGMTISQHIDAEGLSVSKLTGMVVDQAALHGVLKRIRDLNLPLISVTSCAQHPNCSDQEIT